MKLILVYILLNTFITLNGMEKEKPSPSNSGTTEKNNNRFLINCSNLVKATWVSQKNETSGEKLKELVQWNPINEALQFIGKTITKKDTSIENLFSIIEDYIEKERKIISDITDKLHTHWQTMSSIETKRQHEQLTNDIIEYQLHVKQLAVYELAAHLRSLAIADMKLHEIDKKLTKL
jgi:archaellum component FlaC